jgi:hypothetical protein
VNLKPFGTLRPKRDSETSHILRQVSLVFKFKHYNLWTSDFPKRGSPGCLFLWLYLKILMTTSENHNSFILKTGNGGREAQLVNSSISL